MKKSTRIEVIALFILIFVAIASGILLSKSNVVIRDAVVQTSTSTFEIQPETQVITQDNQMVLENKQILPIENTTSENPTVEPAQPTTSINLVEKIPATLFVIDQKYDANITAGSNIYEMMNEISNLTDFRFKAKYFSGMGYFIEEINGVRNNQQPGYNWIYYINNIKSTIGVSNYLIKSNDIITWKYETTNF